MNELQVFNFNNNEVRTLLINDEPYFVGKDIAEVLGYKNPRKAMLDHVDEEDKTYGVTIRDSIGREQKPICINESGLYSLILSSKLPQAKEFKRWVTSEVLPAIRKTGGYKLPQTPMDILKVTYDALKETNDTVAKHDLRIKELEENKSLTPGEYNYISRAVKNKVKTVMKELDMNLIGKQRSQIYHAINRDLNCFIGIKTRSQFKAKDFDKALEFIEKWQLSYTDKKIIEQMCLDI